MATERINIIVELKDRVGRASTGIMGKLGNMAALIAGPLGAALAIWDSGLGKVITDLLFMEGAPWSDEMERLKEQFQEQGAAILEKLLPAIGPLLEGLLQLAIDALPLVADAIIFLIEEVWPVLVDWIQQAWEWMSVHLFPVIREGAEIVIPILVEALDNFVLGVSIVWDWLQVLWAYIDQNILPIFSSLWQGIGNVVTAVQNLITWLQNLWDKFTQIDLGAMWNLIGQSPSPLEAGIMGANAALREMARSALPELQMAANFGARGDSFVTSSNVVTVNNTLNLNSSARSENVVGSFALLNARAGGI